MNNKRTTKRALLTSVMALVMCVVMLVGTTFAWFTDTASTGVNKIQAGNLDVQLLDESGSSLEGKALRWVKADGHSEEAVLWEPGCTYDLESFKIKNNGNLALKYEVKITGITGSAKLLEAIEFTVDVATSSGDTTNPASSDLNNFNGTLAAGTETGLITITGKMKTEAGNEYQGLTIDGISITVYATQLNSEADSTGTDYDEDAEYNYKSATIMGENGATTTLELGKTYNIGDATVTVDNNGNITYNNEKTYAEGETGQTVTITTEGGDLTVNAPNDTIYHYGEAGNVQITAINANSFHEFGKVDILEIQKGRVVVENGNNVAVLQVKPAENEVPVVAVPQSEVLETKLQVDNGKKVEVAVIDNDGAKITNESFTIEQAGTNVSQDIPEELVKVLNKNEDGQVTLEEPKTYKAMIGITPYESFDNALTSAAEKSIIKLVVDNDASNLVINKAVTIDLNGKTLTATNQPKVGDSGVLTIQDSGVNGQLTLGTSGAIQLNEGKLILNSGKIYRDGDGCVSLMDKAQFEINGGALLCTKGGCIDAGYVTDNATVTINGGTIESKATNVCAVYISGRKILGSDNSSPVAVTVAGGTITSAGSKAVEVNGTNSKLTVSGGTFNGDIVNTVGTVEFTSTSYKLNGNYVVNTSEALAAAVTADFTDSETKVTTTESNIDKVALGSDIKLTSPLEIHKTMTVVGNGHTLTTSSSNSRVINCNDNTGTVVLTLSGVKIDASTIERGISVYGNSDVTLVLDDCEVTADHYAINIAKNNTNPKVIARNTEMTGYSAYQTWSSNTDAVATFENCTLIGLNKWSGTSDDFAAIVINDGVKPSNLTFKNCTIKAIEQGTANEDLLSVREENATVTFEGCKFFVNGTEVTGDAIQSNMKTLNDTNLTIK